MRLSSLCAGVLLFVLSPALSAQYSVVTEVDRPMSFGTRPGFSVGFPNTDQKLVDEVWTDFVKNNFAGKLKKGKKGEKSASQLRSVSVSSNDFTLYSKLEKVGDGAQLDVWFDIGPFFLNRREDATRTNETKELLTRFYYDVRRAAVGQEVKGEEEKLKEMEAKIKKLQRDNSTLNKDIETYKAKLKKAEADLVQNQKDQEATIIDIDKQRQAVEAARQRQGNVENERQ